ncbi:MAG: S41 family peptidase [Oscillospiraceae bacterium]|nr:S41 family peptidase [Oscillospiraceae bacterium]
MKQYKILIYKALGILLAIGVCLSVSGCHFTISPVSHVPANAAPAEQQDTAYKQKVDEIVAILDQYYVDGYSTDQLGDYLAEAVIASIGDRWSYYISADDYNAYMESNANAYVGIGVTIELTKEDDPGFTILSVTHNSPAEAAGLQIGDMIVGVEGESAAELGITESQHRVRGEAGTDVTITIRRNGEDFDVTITRQEIKVDVVVYELLENNVGYIKINNFDTRSSTDAIAAIEDLTGQGADCLIFDLRFNPGGMKHELVKLLDYLLPEGPLFRSVDYKGKEEVDYSDADCLDVPMAVLVNDDSYSAAEFFAAALQEYKAGVIVGTQTCGKANYQQTFRLSDGSAIAISTGHYQTPNGVTLAGVGVTPDVIVEVDEETYLDLYYEKIARADDEQLQAAIAALGK